MPETAANAPLVIFDLDGTLADTAEDLVAAVNATLEALGRPALPFELIRGFIGEGARNLVQRSLGAPGNLDEALVSRAVELWRAFYGQHVADRSRLYPGIERLLGGLPGPLAVNTNKPGELARKLLAELGIASRFFRVVGGGDVPSRKPDPEGLRLLASEAKAQRVVLVGDSHIDAQTALAAELPFLAVTWGYGSREQLLGAGARHFAETPEEVAALLSRWPF